MAKTYEGVVNLNGVSVHCKVFKGERSLEKKSMLLSVGIEDLSVAKDLYAYMPYPLRSELDNTDEYCSAGTIVLLCEFILEFSRDEKLTMKVFKSYSSISIILDKVINLYKKLVMFANDALIDEAIKAMKRTANDSAKN